MKRIIALLLVFTLFFSLSPLVFASNNEAEKSAERLGSLGLLKGVGFNPDGSRDYDLDSGLTREQAVIMLVRLLGKEDEALRSNCKMPFTDVSDWAADYVAYAYEKGLANGTGLTTFHGTTPVTAAHYLTFVLRALGYSSESDFKWDKPWELAKKVGINSGEYNDSTSSAFIRADMAIVSSRALDAELKLGGMTLLESIKNVYDFSPADYLDRRLTDSELASLKSASLDTLRKKISTVGDAVAFLDQFSPRWFSGFSDSLRLDIEFLYDLHTRPEATFSHTYTAFTAWCITDDFEDVRYLICTGALQDYFRTSPALILPITDGYYIYSPYETSSLLDPGSSEPVKAMTLSSLSGIEESVSINWTNPKPYQIFIAPADQKDLQFAVDEAAQWASLTSGKAELVYSISDEEKAELEEQRREEIARVSLENLRSRWNSYGFPASFAPSMSESKIKALIGKDIDTVSGSLKTLGDVLYYLALGGYYTTNGDIKVWEDGLCWSFNDAPETVFANNAGNCGGTAAFVAYLLTGDYNEAGCISMTLDIDIGGGHVITYLKDGGTYYVFDSRALVDSNYSWNGGITSGSTLVSAGQKWRSENDPSYKLMFAYPTTEGDIPALGDYKTVYLPTQYRDRITIVYEATSEGYKYDWRSISADVLEKINGLRRPVSSTPDSDVTIDRSGNYFTRVLTDAQLVKLKWADKETLRSHISTAADAVAWLEQFNPNHYSGFEGEIRLDIDFLLPLHSSDEATTGQTYSAFTAWCLSDDYDGIKYIISIMRPSEWIQTLTGLALPCEGGYYVYSPCSDAKEYMSEYFHDAQLSDLSSLESKLVPTCSSPYGPLQIFVADSEQPGLRFSLDEERGCAVVSIGKADEVFVLSDDKKDELEQLAKLERIKFAWDALQRNWSSYGMPASMAPTMSRSEVEALVGKDIDTVAAACKTLGDCLYYYALSGFTGSGGDLQVHDPSIGSRSLFWHFNYAPGAVFDMNTGNCGGSSGLTAYLLKGDYATVGMLGMTFEEGAGGGHFINYLYDGSKYYAFDIVNLLSEFRQNGFCFNSGNSLKSAAYDWADQSGFPVKLMWAYQSFTGDIPVGWDWPNRISYLPADCKNGAEIIMETPAEGYVYEWVDISPSVQASIDRARNP